jgi:hypothetical protein
MSNIKPDQDAVKGATETGKPVKSGQSYAPDTGMKEQLGHRDQDPLIKDADSDFPEPGGSPEHTGENERESA